MKIKELLAYLSTFNPETELEAIEVNPKRKSGDPVIKGTRFTVSQMCAEISEKGSIQEFANDFGFDPKLIEEVLLDLARIFFNQTALDEHNRRRNSGVQK